MNLVKCSKGHYYDGDKYASCPHCVSQTPAGDSVTVAMPVSSGAVDATVSLSSVSGVDPVTVPSRQILANDPVTIPSREVPAKDPVAVSNVQNVAGDPITIPSRQITQEETAGTKSADLGQAVSSIQEASFQNVMDLAQKSDFSAQEDDSRTMSYYTQKISVPVIKEPVVGWLVCTSGKYFGQAFSLKSGRNFVGRNSDMDVCLEGEMSVSRERHAVIIYEPHERIFIAQPGDSRELFYLNDDVVLDNEVLKPYDVLSLGKVNLMIIPCCTKDFAWEDLERKEKSEDQ